MVQLTAAGGVIYKKNERERIEILLIYRNGGWDLPKGKKEENESVEDCARREVAEEVGIPLPQIECFLVQTYHEYERKGKKYGKTTHWYRMRSSVRTGFEPQTEEGIEDVQWFEIDNAKQKIDFHNLREVLQVLKMSVK